MKEEGKAYISCTSSLLFGLSGDLGQISKSLHKQSDLMTHPFAYECEQFEELPKLFEEKHWHDEEYAYEYLREGVEIGEDDAYWI